jgi:E3 ubiquitin-protein ligase HECTD2
MGLAVYNGEILDIRFPSVVYKKLLTVETPSLNSDCTIGTSRHLTLYDLKQVMPDLASSLYNMLEFEGDVQDTFMLKFQVSYTEYDTVKTVALKRNGENIDLTNENRKEYVDLYVDFLLNKLIYEQFKAFYLGFHSVCASNAMLVIELPFYF